MAREIVFAPEAQDDLTDLYDYIASDAGAARALDYTERIVAYCRAFVTFPERGTRHDDLRSGLRTTGFGRRVTIAFHVTEDQIVFDRILYGGRDLTTAMQGRRR